ncbi:DUF2207 domain-containing protein [Candidatus Pacebacteria bacterium]|nr:DUF2207 domain-containing protein [Candidatus Paceibacterota bacterium]
MKGFILLLFVLAWLVFPSVSRAESVERFESRMDVQPDGTVAVTERITYDFGAANRRGIYRVLDTSPAQAATSWYKHRFVDIILQSVERNGVTEPHVVTESGREFNLRIGNPDKTITGAHTYTISYLLSGALAYGEDGTELYWNATGDDWSVPLSAVSVTVTGAPELLRDQRDCYQGTVGVTKRCDSITSTSENEAVFTAEQLLPGEQLTIAQSLDPELVEERIVERINLFLIIIPLFGTALVGFGVWLYRFKTKFRPDQPIIAQYEPYEKCNPMYTGLLLDGRLDPHDITAGILTLAERGYLKIHKTEKTVLLFFEVTDYEIELVRAVDDELLAYEKQALLLLGLHDLRVGSKVSLRDIAKNTSQQRSNQEHRRKLKHSLASRMVTEGYFQDMTIIRRRTKKGYEARYHLLGFKEFLEVTDKDRFTFHNSPEKSPTLFLEYLPYAIAFGVEQQWADVFADITIPNPEWYSGGANVANFSATDFTSSMSALSSSMASSGSTGSTGSSGGGSAGGGGGGGGGGSW